jgi:hypothetical protein
MRRLSLLILLFAATAQAETRVNVGSIATQDADDVAITGGSIGAAVVGSTEAYGPGYENDLGFLTKHDYRTNQEATVGSGVDSGALPDAFVIGGASTASGTIRPGTGVGETLTMGGVDTNGGGAVTGARIVLASGDTPSLTLHGPGVVGDLTGDGSGALAGFTSGDFDYVNVTDDSDNGHSISFDSGPLAFCFNSNPNDASHTGDGAIKVGSITLGGQTNLNTWATKTPYVGSLAIASGKTFTASNTLTLAGTDGSTLNVGTGGTLGTAAYTAASAYQAADADLTGWAAKTPYVGTLTIGTGDSLTVDSTISLTGTPSSTLDIADGGILGQLAFANSVAIATQVSGLGSGVATAAAINVNTTGGLLTHGGAAVHTTISSTGGINSTTSNSYTVAALNVGGTSTGDGVGFAGSETYRVWLRAGTLGSSGVGASTTGASVVTLGFGTTIWNNVDTYLARDGAAGTLQMGLDAAGATGQTLKGPDRITTDGVGGNFTIAGGRNRGAASGGSVIIQTSPSASAGTPGSLINRMEFRGDGNVIMDSLPTSDPSINGALWNNGGTLSISAG